MRLSILSCEPYSPHRFRLPGAPHILYIGPGIQI